MSKELQKLQQQFQATLLDGESTPLATLFIPPHSDHMTQRFAIYRNGYVQRLTTALSCSFPCLMTLMGTTAFHKAAHTYLSKQPSTFTSITEISPAFIDFIGNQVTYPPYYRLLAHFEWQLYEIGQRPNPPELLTIASLQAIPIQDWASLHFTLQPSLSFLELTHDIPTLWQQLQSASLEAVGPSHTPDPFDQQRLCIIWHDKNQAHFMLSETNEARMLKAIKQGLSFSEICAQLSDQLPEEKIARFAAHTLQRWIQANIFQPLSHPHGS